PDSRLRPSEVLIVAGGLTGFAALLAQLLGAGERYRVGGESVIGMAATTVLAMLLLCVGLLLERPGMGVTQALVSSGPGGFLLRRLLPAALVTPAILGIVVKQASTALGLSDVSIALAILAAGLTLAGLIMLVITAFSLNRWHEALETALRRTEELFEQASDGVFIADLDGRYTDVNSAGCRMLGYSRKELVGRTIMDLIPAEDISRLEDSRALLLQGDVQVSEWTMRRKDGSYLPVEVSAKILADGRWQGMVRDVSERKRLEGALRFSEAKSTGILSVSLDAFISLDEGQRITMFNDGAEKIFHYLRSEVLGRPFDILLPERSRDTHRRQIAQFAASNETARRLGEGAGAIVALRKESEEFPAEAAISKLEVDGARILTIALRDVTEQRHAEMAQRFRAEALSVLTPTPDYEHALNKVAELAVREFADHCVVCIIEEDGATRSTTASRDPARAWACEMLFSTPGHQSDLWIFNTVLGSSQPTLLKEALPELMSATFNKKHLWAVRALVPKSAIAAPLVSRNKLLGRIILLSAAAARPYGPDDLAVAVEVAERAALSIDNARLYRSARRAIEARDDVLAIVAHDLRSPLNTILLQAHLLPQAAGATGQSREPLEVIARAVKRMSSLINDLLDVTQLESSGLSIERYNVPARQIILDAIEAQRVPASAASLDLRSEVPDELSTVWADRDRLLQVFENLIGNAIKFTKPGGQIVAGALQRPGDVLFWVSDTGTGIAPDALPHIFDRFWQERKTRRSGVGLGLRIAKGIVEAHGGQIWANSAPGLGATFSFTIPVSLKQTGTTENISAA
ncbi:MAG TPA: PAS domain S-box protein, partial [Terriglobia bacterium]|nr:PAS domain S-box protein [Terriglobia bacterium]